MSSRGFCVSLASLALFSLVNLAALQATVSCLSVCVSVNMATIVLEEFVANPNLVKLNECRKKDLAAIAVYNGIAVSSLLVKQDLKRFLLNVFSACRCPLKLLV